MAGREGGLDGAEVGRLWTARVAPYGHRSAGALMVVCGQRDCPVGRQRFRDREEAGRAALILPGRCPRPPQLPPQGVGRTEGSAWDQWPTAARRAVGCAVCAQQGVVNAPPARAKKPQHAVARTGWIHDRRRGD
ncbi:hypothetical protein [Streptomyces sp. NPDC057909]|uniref:hypothetical protein n=1 Tax=Streptomyces sp. NPDC057909 TaxID=3346277 RepID=UPI0036EED598